MAAILWACNYLQFVNNSKFFFFSIWDQKFIFTFSPHATWSFIHVCQLKYRDLQPRSLNLFCPPPPTSFSSSTALFQKFATIFSTLIIVTASKYFISLYISTSTSISDIIFLGMVCMIRLRSFFFGGHVNNFFFGSAKIYVQF